MKLKVKVNDVVDLVRRFEASPATAMRDLGKHVRQGAGEVLERVRDAEIQLLLGQNAGTVNERTGYASRAFGVKGIGALHVRVPRDRPERAQNNVVPNIRPYDEALEKDLALLQVAGLSTRMLSHLSRSVFGLSVSPADVSNALRTILPAAKTFLERDLSGRRFKYLWVDGANFKKRRSTVDREPTLVVIGADDADCKSVLAMVEGDKNVRSAWDTVFATLKQRGLAGNAIELGIMNGLPGLREAFLEAFSNARIAHCWVHKLRNVMTHVPRRYRAEFKRDWDKVAYASSHTEAGAAFASLKKRWSGSAGDAVASFEKDRAALFCHYDFPREHWNALRTTNPIERINQEFTRRSKSMEQMDPDGLKTLLAFTALRLECGWSITPITSAKLANLYLAPTRKGHFSAVDVVSESNSA